MKLTKHNTDPQEARVLPFQRADRAAVRRHGQQSTEPSGGQTPASGLESYERPKGLEDDYRHRMIVNAGALAVCVLLGAAGIWVAISIADLRRNQDCVLAGRKNCAELSIPPGANLTGNEKAAAKRFPTE